VRSTAIPPVPREPNDHATSAVHAHLRALILEGTLAPGSVLNQVELAPQLGVSRTPLREAIRTLQEEGLVEQEPQKRARVVGFDPADLEAAYVQRILLEGLAAGLTAPAASAEDLARLQALLDEMRRRARSGDLERWQFVHKEFHLELVSGAGPALGRTLRTQMDRSEHYRILSQAAGLRSWSAASAEHEGIVEAFIAHDGEAASSRLGAHLAMTALTLMAQLAPTYDPEALRAAAIAVGA
jgi:DNA-binding GntR family transcriptional regulator